MNASGEMIKPAFGSCASGAIAGSICAGSKTGAATYSFSRSQGQYCQFSNGNCFAIGQNGQTTNWGWYAGGGFDYVVHQGPLVDVILGAEYQHYDISSKNAFCLTSCAPASGADYDLGVKGDIVRARLTIKTKGYGFFY